MARISSFSTGGRYRVSVEGPLSASDLARLETACGPALEHKHVPLDIQLSHVTAMDAAARLFLQHLATRGAVISAA